MKSRLPWLFPLLFVVSACQLPVLRDDDPDADEADAVAVEQVEAADEPGRLARAIEYLQDGEVERAEGLLVDHLAQHPGHRLASRLLEQVREEPRDLLGSDYDEVVVQPGDTLSQLAARHAGDGMLFFALARLNQIERPRLLQPGTVLRVPSTEKIAVQNDTEEPEAEAEHGNAQARAGMMLAEGEADQALDLLLAAAGRRELDAAGRNLMAQAAVMVSEQHMEEGRLDEASMVLDQLDSHSAANEEGVALQRNRVMAREYLVRAEVAAAAGDGELVNERLESALDLDPSLAAGGGHLQYSRAALVEKFHGRALKAWREQEVEVAVDYWERVLELDPEFAPAQVYLERGREVLKRLEEL